MDEKAILDHLVEIKASVAANMEKTVNIEKAVLGNGQPGLVQKVTELEKANAFNRGAAAVVMVAYGLFDQLKHHLGY